MDNPQDSDIEKWLTHSAKTSLPQFKTGVGFESRMALIARMLEQAPAERAEACLIYEVDGEVRHLPLRDGMQVGREVDCDWVLDDLCVSRHHAKFMKDADDWLVRDLGSSNGTFVNGKAVTVRALVEGDSIALGEQVFLFLGASEKFPEA